MNPTMEPEELQQILRDQGLTHYAAGLRLGVRDKTISRWVNGKNPIPAPMVKLIHYELLGKKPGGD